jgi:thiol-disulfide isomerase/thioredoxin
MSRQKIVGQLSGIASLLALAGWLALATGCNKSGEKAAAAPTLSVPASNTVAADEQPASTKPADTVHEDEEKQADPPPSRISVSVEQDETNAVIKQVQTNFAAWNQGKPFDFTPPAKQIVGWLDNGLDQRSCQLGGEVARICESTGSYEPAKLLYSALVKAAAKSDNQRLAVPAREIGSAGLTRLDLLGSKPKIEGTIFGGDKLDWDKYRGKIVLIDFWATWCGPCMQELPNVKKVYEKYHTQGFDIVGVTLDDDKDRLAAFLDKEQLPWPTLFEDDPEKHGFEGVPLVKTFGIDGIPATYLFDRSGKIVSISARGEDLDAQVKKLLAEKK